MEVSFHTKFLRDLCERPGFAHRELGELGAKKLYSRLADIESAESLEELVGLNLVSVKEDELIINLTDKFDAVFQKYQNGTPRNGNGSGLPEIRRIKLVEIKNGKSN